MANNQTSQREALTLYFVRHGETQDNIDRILQGWRDTSLTEKGLTQADEMSQKLNEQHIDAIYHSPLIRMKQTIKPIISSHSNVPTNSDPDLRGQGLGELEGGSYDSIDMGNPRSADGQPGVELFDDFVGRLKRVLGRIIAAEVTKMKPGQEHNVVIATHGVCITSMFKALENTIDGQSSNRKIAVRGSDAYEVRWTDSDDIAKLVVANPTELPLQDGQLEWNKIEGQPFLIDTWGKKEKAL